MLFQTAFHRVFQPLAQMAHVRFHSRKRVHTLGFRRRIAHNGSHGETGGRFGWGWYHYSRSVPHVHQHPRAGYQNGKFCRFWVLVGDAPEERREPRNSDALMRVAVPRRRGPAGLRDFFVSVEIVACMPCTQSFLCVRSRGGITTLSALYVLSKRWTAACQNGSFAVF